MFRDNKLIMYVKNERFNELEYVLNSAEAPFKTKKIVLKF